MKDPIEQKLRKARVQMLMNMPFFGVLATHLRLKEIAPEHCRTFGTDGRTFYYNRDVVDMLDDEELKFAFAHVVMHCCYDHMGVIGKRDPEIFAKATDLVINLEISDQNVGKVINRPDDDMVATLDTDYRGMSSAEIYEKLSDEQGDGDGDGSGDGQGQGQGDGQSQGNGAGQGGGSGLDVHFDPKAASDDDSGVDQLSDEERQEIRDAFRQATLEAAKSAGSDHVPAGIRELLDDLLDPQMDWRECLNANVQTLVKNDWTFSRPNRRNSSLGGIILPGNDVDEAVSVCCAIDTSGSISHQMIREFLSEIKGIMEQFAQFEITIWCFDTDTYTIWKYNEDNSDEIHEFVPEGGGGTDFMVNWTMMIDKEIEPDQFIMFTDGYPYGDWGMEEYQDNMVFLISGDPDRRITAPFGTTLWYED